MRTAHRPSLTPAVVACAVLLLMFTIVVGGCTAEAGAEVGGREVLSRTSSLNGTSVCGDGKSAQFVLAMRAFDVDQHQISWAPGHVLALPDNWNKLELVQSGRFVIVRIDGKDFHKIDPAA